jgi:DNA-binding transcriptional LysR family regulator
MELRQLQTFVRVAELRSFSRAAEELLLSQPAVTRQVAALERELGARLLDRLGHRIEPTPAGEALQRRASEILRLEAETRREVSDIGEGAAGRLTIGASSTAAAYVLPPLLARYRAAHPAIQLRVRTGASAQIRELALANAVEVGLISESEELAALRQVPVCELETVLVLHSGHPLARAVEAVRGAELAGTALLMMPPGTTLREHTDRLLAASGAQIEPDLELDSVETIKRMIEARLGIALLPRAAVEREAAAGALLVRPLAGPGEPYRRVTAIYRKDKYVTTAMRGFLAMLGPARRI